MNYLLATFTALTCFFSSFNMSAQVNNMTAQMTAQVSTVLSDGFADVIENSEMRILSYNIQMLPRFLFSRSRGNLIRARLIPDKVLSDNIDIVVFQEAFDRKARKILVELLGDAYPYIIGPTNGRTFPFKINSGVMIFSKVPLKQLNKVDYRDCDGADCYARKGAILTEGEWHGTPFQLLGTHLNSGRPTWIKRNQYEQIRGLIDAYRKDGVPQFLCGDFNTGKSDQNLYHEMLTTLDAGDGPLYSSLVYTDDPVMNDMNGCDGQNEKCDVIDYIFYRNNGVKPEKMERLVRQYQQRWSRQYQDLSDHNALLMRVKF